MLSTIFAATSRRGRRAHLSSLSFLRQQQQQQKQKQQQMMKCYFATSGSTTFVVEEVDGSDVGWCLKSLSERYSSWHCYKLGPAAQQQFRLKECGTMGTFEYTGIESEAVLFCGLNDKSVCVDMQINVRTVSKQVVRWLGIHNCKVLLDDNDARKNLDEYFTKLKLAMSEMEHDDEGGSSGGYVRLQSIEYDSYGDSISLFDFVAKGGLKDINFVANGGLNHNPYVCLSKEGLRNLIGLQPTLQELLETKWDLRNVALDQATISFDACLQDSLETESAKRFGLSGEEILQRCIKRYGKEIK